VRSDLREQLQLYLDGRRSLKELNEWMVINTWNCKLSREEPRRLDRGRVEATISTAAG